METGSRAVSPTAAAGNSLGFLRLILALAVIVSHSAQFVHGRPAADPLKALTGTLTIGEVAVLQFFVISGFLIAGSYLRQRSLLTFLWARIVRIYPAFVVATLIGLIVVAPVAGADPQLLWQDAGGSLRRMIMLEYPEAPGAFAGTNHAILNGSMWTIVYEARCYLLVAALGVTGLLGRRAVMAVLVAACLATLLLIPLPTLNEAGRLLPRSTILIGAGDHMVQFAFAFLVGSVFYLFRDRLPFTGPGGLVAAGVAAVGLFSPLLALPALVICGGYAVFAFAFSTRNTALVRINAGNDISYGTYLYAWPVGKLALLWFPAMSAAPLALLTAIVGTLIGTVSWFALEKPLIRRWARSRSGQPALAAARPEVGSRPATL